MPTHSHITPVQNSNVRKCTVKKHTLDMLHDGWAVLRMLRCSPAPGFQMLCVARIEWLMCKLQLPVCSHKSGRNILPCYSHKSGNCTISNYYWVSKCSTYPLFTDPNSLPKISNHVSLYMYVCHVESKSQLKLVTDGLSSGNSNWSLSRL